MLFGLMQATLPLQWPFRLAGGSQGEALVLVQWINDLKNFFGLPFDPRAL